jgi:hypothetical protein
VRSEVMPSISVRARPQVATASSGADTWAYANTSTGFGSALRQAARLGCVGLCLVAEGEWACAGPGPYLSNRHSTDTARGQAAVAVPVC